MATESACEAVRPKNTSTAMIPPSTRTSPPGKTVREGRRQPALAIADHQQAGNESDGDQQPDDEGGKESFGDSGAKADQAADDQQAHQDQEVERALAEDRAQPLRTGDVGLLAMQIRAIEVAHLRGQHTVGEPGEDHDVEQLTEPIGFASVAQKDLPANGSHHEGEVEGG